MSLGKGRRAVARKLRDRRSESESVVHASDTLDHVLPLTAGVLLVARALRVVEPTDHAAVAGHANVPEVSLDISSRDRISRVDDGG